MTVIAELTISDPPKSCYSQRIYPNLPRDLSAYDDGAAQEGMLRESRPGTPQMEGKAACYNSVSVVAYAIGHAMFQKE